MQKKATKIENTKKNNKKKEFAPPDTREVTGKCLGYRTTVNPQHCGGTTAELSAKRHVTHGQVSVVDEGGGGDGTWV